MFNVAQLSALACQTRARALVGFGGEPEIAKCAQAAPLVERFVALDPGTVDELIAAGATDERTRARGRRHRDGDALSGTTSEPKGIVHSSNTLRYATEGICRRWDLGEHDRCLVATEFGFVGGLSSGTSRSCSTAAPAS